MLVIVYPNPPTRRKYSVESRIPLLLITLKSCPPDPCQKFSPCGICSSGAEAAGFSLDLRKHQQATSIYSVSTLLFAITGSRCCSGQDYHLQLLRPRGFLSTEPMTPGHIVHVLSADLHPYVYQRRQLHELLPCLQFSPLVKLSFTCDSLHAILYLPFQPFSRLLTLILVVLFRREVQEQQLDCPLLTTLLRPE